MNKGPPFQVKVFIFFLYLSKYASTFNFVVCARIKKSSLCRLKINLALGSESYVYSWYTGLHGSEQYIFNWMLEKPLNLQQEE
jgi:hypothetical protein